MKKHAVQMAGVTVPCLSLFLSLTAAAHEHHHHETPPVPAASTPAPPLPPAPPPVVVEPPKPMVVNYQLPVIAPNMLVPTDMAGIGGGLGYARGLKNQLIRKGPTPQKIQLIARDSRYDFSGDWLPFKENPADQKQAAAPSGQNSIKHTLNVEKWVVSTRYKSPLFMASRGTDYTRGVNELTVTSGSVIVRAGSEPVTVFISHNGNKIPVKISSDALALVSVLDDKPIVLNLTDRCCGAVVVQLPSDKPDQSRLSLGVGEMFELHANHDKPFSTYLASHIIEKKDAGNEQSYQLTRCHYLSVIRRFNLDKSLDRGDLSRVLKTAAALAHVNPGHKNN